MDPGPPALWMPWFPAFDSAIMEQMSSSRSEGADGWTRAAGQTRRAPISGSRVWLYRILVVGLAPLLVVGLLEGGLRLAGWRRPTDFLVVRSVAGPVTGPVAARADQGPKALVNQRFSARFFERGLEREPFPAALDEKPKGTVRIVVLGESAAYGDPTPAFGLARCLEVLLEARFPQRRFEVVNAAMTAINSHAILPIARSCAEHHPDLFVVYMGNNEVVGPFGPGTGLTPFADNLERVRTGLWLRTTAVGQLAARLGDWTASLGANPAVWRGMEMMLERPVSWSDPRLEPVMANFRRNLVDICRVAMGTVGRSGKVIACTVATNLRDCPPFASVHRADLEQADLERWSDVYDEGLKLEQAGASDAAADQFLAAEEIDPDHAELHFRLARAAESNGDPEKARYHYRLARDLDALRFRADSRINQLIRAVAAAEPDRIELVDAEEVFEEESAGGVPGSKYFLEHVHLTFAGNVLLAERVADKVAQVIPELGHGGSSTEIGAEDLAARLAWTPREELKQWTEIHGRMTRPPFTNQLGHERELQARIDQFAERWENERRRDPADELASYRKALAARPSDWLVRERLAQHLLEGDDPAGAASEAEQVTRDQPWRARAWQLKGNALERLGRRAEAVAAYRAATTAYPVDLASPSALAQAHMALGLALRGDGQEEEGERAIQQAFALAPTLPALYVQYAGALLPTDPARAAEQLRAALALDPTDARASFLLARWELDQGQGENALEHLRAAAVGAPLNPDYAKALGACAARTGDLGLALDAYGRAERLRPDDATVPLARGEVLARQGDSAGARDAFEQALRLDSDSPEARYALAWLLATADRDDLRDGERALELAEGLCAENEPVRPEYLDALAAALAEVGQFDRAVKIAGRASDLAVARGARSLSQDILARRAAYQRRLAHRHSGRGPSVPSTPSSRAEGSD